MATERPRASSRRTRRTAGPTRWPSARARVPTASSCRAADTKMSPSPRWLLRRLLVARVVRSPRGRPWNRSRVASSWAAPATTSQNEPTATTLQPASPSCSRPSATRRRDRCGLVYATVAPVQIVDEGARVTTRAAARPPTTNALASSGVCSAATASTRTRATRSRNARLRRGSGRQGEIPRAGGPANEAKNTAETCAHDRAANSKSESTKPCRGRITRSRRVRGPRSRASATRRPSRDAARSALTAEQGSEENWRERERRATTTATTFRAMAEGLEAARTSAGPRLTARQTSSAPAGPLRLDVQVRQDVATTRLVETRARRDDALDDEVAPRGARHARRGAMGLARTATAPTSGRGCQTVVTRAAWSAPAPAAGSATPRPTPRRPTTSRPMDQRRRGPVRSVTSSWDCASQYDNLRS